MVKKSLAALAAALLIHGIAQAAGADTSAGAAASADAAASASSASADAAASASSASADSADADAPASAWAAQGQLGLIVSRGNSVTNSGNALFNAAHAMGRWTLSGGFAALYASSAGITTQQDTAAHLQADLELSKRTFWFTNAMYDRNLFTGFVYQESIATGGGLNLIQSPATQLSVELGIGDRRQEPEILLKNPLGEVILRTPQPVVNEAVLVAAATYSHTLTATTKFMNSLQVQSGSSDTLTTDNLALQVKIDASLSLAVGLQLVNNTSPPPGNVKHTDTVMTVNLVYELKNPKLSATGAPSLVRNINYNLP